MLTHASMKMWERMSPNEAGAFFKPFSSVHKFFQFFFVFANVTFISIEPSR
jgi:hypothetical protein